MAWLRIDDGYTSNSKIAQLTDAEFRAWMRLLCHCARSRDPSVDEVAKREVSGLSLRKIHRFNSLGLLDEVGDCFEVHDWTKFLPKDEQNATRQAKWRARHRNASRNAPSNAAGNADLTPETSHAGAGTRGVPSRPVPKDEEEDYEPSNDEMSGGGPREPSLTSASASEADAGDEQGPPWSTKYSPDEQEPWEGVLRDL